jgi:SAM-dependent methyltransferase
LAGESADIIHARLLELRRPKSLGELLSKSNIEYFAPADGRATGLEPNSIDLVYSNSVLEHVPREVISGLMEESFRVLRPGGLAMHNVGCNDHYAFFDKSISFVNYLQYEERDWRLWNNSLQYQNRLRAPEFLELAMQAGFEVINNRTHVRPGTLEALAGLRVAPQFERFSRDELTATTTDFIVRKPER